MVFLFLISSNQARMLQAQEPAFFAGNRAARFEVHSGYFHYVFLCRSTVEFQAQFVRPSLPLPPSEPAICWPVGAVKMVKTNGKFEGGPQALGTLVVSEHNLRFVPGAGHEDQYIDFRKGEARFERQPGNNFAFFGTTELFYKIAFMSLCASCQPGSSVPVDAAAAQLDLEYGLFQESLSTFDSAMRRAEEWTSDTRIRVGPENQPGVLDPPESMGLYSDLNGRLAGLCPDLAKACIQSFAKYQACMNTSQRDQGCGAVPSCTVDCRLGQADLRSLNAAVCVQRDQTQGTLIPDWSAELRKTDPARPIRPYQPAALDVEATPTKSTFANVGCGVKQSYLRASMPPPSSGFGVAGMEGLSVFGGPGGAHTVPADPKRVAISAGVALGMLLQKVTPVYPPVAKAARVQGTVILQGTINKEGAISELRIVDGPALLQEAAMDAVKQWRYRPFLLKDEPVEVTTTINVVFTLGDSPSAPQAPPAPSSQP